MPQTQSAKCNYHLRDDLQADADAVVNILAREYGTNIRILTEMGKQPQVILL